MHTCTCSWKAREETFKGKTRFYELLALNHRWEEHVQNLFGRLPKPEICDSFSLEKFSLYTLALIASMSVISHSFVVGCALDAELKNCEIMGNCSLKGLTLILSNVKVACIPTACGSHIDESSCLTSSVCVLFVCTVKPLITDSPRSTQPPNNGQMSCPGLSLL